MDNKVQLITYVDRLGGGGVSALRRLLSDRLAGVFGGVHLLPFFAPIDGADAGFDPVDHTQVDPRLGNWDDVRDLSQTLPVMADVIVNHVSSESPQFQDFLARGEESAYNGLFLTFNAVFPKGATEADLLAIYRPRPSHPMTTYVCADGTRRILWTTFTARQIDIDVEHPLGVAYLDSILAALSTSGVTMVRLDAVGYAIKRAGRSGFMMPETFAFIDSFTQRARAYGLEVLVEVHSHFQKQIEIARRVDRVYDFALPPLLLHAIFFRTAETLARWIEIRPQNAITVLDTHDGIGIIDIGAEGHGPNALPGLVPPRELDATVEKIHSNSRNQSREATGAAASNLDLYQVNCTYFDALGGNISDYLLTRAIQFFLPGVPQVYYVGLLGGRNDMSLLKRSLVGRDINRHYYNATEIDGALDTPLVQDLIALIKFRNAHPSFGGTFSYSLNGTQSLSLRWQRGAHTAVLDVDFATLQWDIHASKSDAGNLPEWISRAPTCVAQSASAAFNATTSLPCACGDNSGCESKRQER